MINIKSANVVLGGFGGLGVGFYLRMKLGDWANISLVHEEARHSSQEGAASKHRVFFVVASDIFADALEHFSPQQESHVRVMPARESDGGTGLRVSWPVFEKGLVRPSRGR